MNVKELTAAVAELQQQVRELCEIINAQGAEIKALHNHRAPMQQREPVPVHLDRTQRLAAVARLSAKYPNAHCFTAAQVQAEIAEAA